MMMRVCKLVSTVNTPTRATDGSAGYDLYCHEFHSIGPQSSLLIDCGISIKIPPNHVGIIKSRSGLASKNGLDVAAGVIDSDYRGPLKVLIRNTTMDRPYNFSPADRIAQLLIVPVVTPEIMLVDSLESSTRGQGGFGSTGQ